MKKFGIVSSLAFALAALWLVPLARADYKQAVTYYGQGKYQQAVEAIRPDVDKNPDWEPGHRLLGLCYLAQKNNALAENSLKRAVELKSPAFSTYYGLGLAYFNMQRYDSCISALNKGESLASDKEKPKLSKLRGQAYYRMNSFTEAIEDLTNSIRADQSDWTDYSMLGIAYYRLNRMDEAIQALEKALSIKPGESTTTSALVGVYLKKGAAALSAKQYPAALQTLTKAKDLDSRNGYVYYNLAEVYLFEKRYPEAEKALSQAVELMPRSLDVYARMGLVYEKQKKWDLALNAYKKADEISPSKQIKEAIERINENKKKK
jgi:tetratricopeptide (TPR) repeat protein